MVVKQLLIYSATNFPFNNPSFPLPSIRTLHQIRSRAPSVLTPVLFIHLPEEHILDVGVAKVGGYWMMSINEILILREFLNPPPSSPPLSVVVLLLLLRSMWFPMLHRVFL